MFNSKPRKEWWLLNHVPFDGCMLVFNGVQSRWRSKASERGKQLGVKYNIHAITGATREQAHNQHDLSDLYITLK